MKTKGLGLELCIQLMTSPSSGSAQACRTMNGPSGTRTLRQAQGERVITTTLWR